MKKTITIIGAAGSIGSSIAHGLASVGYRLLLTDDIQKHPIRYMKLSLLERKIIWEVPQADVEMAVSRREASWEADIIILAVPCGEQAEVAERIRDVVTGKIIVSLEVPQNVTHANPVADPTISAGDKLALLFPHSKIVKAVNTLFATRSDNQRIRKVSVDVFVSGDDQKAVATVSELVRDAGFHPVAGGTFAMSRDPRGVIAGG